MKTLYGLRYSQIAAVLGLHREAVYKWGGHPPKYAQAWADERQKRIEAEQKLAEAQYMVQRLMRELWQRENRDDARGLHTEPPGARAPVGQNGAADSRT